MSAVDQVVVRDGEYGMDKVRKVTDCMRVDDKLLKGAPSYSKAGISAASKLGGKQGTKAKISSTYLTLDEYANLFKKYYAKDSIMDQVLAKEKAFRESRALAESSSKQKRPMSASAATNRSFMLQSGTAEASMKLKAETEQSTRTTDQEMQIRALREAHAGALPASVARKYGVQGVSTVSASRSQNNPVVNGLTTVLNGGIPSSLQPNMQDAQSVSKVMELSQSLQDSERMRQEAVARAAQRQQEALQMTPKPRPQSASAAFMTTTRQQHERIGKYGLAKDPGIPHVGHYNPRTNYADPHIPRVHIKGTNHREEPRLARTEPRGHEERGEEEEGHGSPEVSPGRRARASKEPAAHKGASATHMALFKDAHQVHRSKAAPKSGSAAFNTTARPQPNVASTANHLFNAYWRDDIDRATLKKTHGSGKFHTQVPRPPPGIETDSPPALGPGSYYATVADLPQTHTGRHVTSAHDKLSRTPAFDGYTSRPGSAKPPPQRPASAAVSNNSAQAALRALFGEMGKDLDPSVLISISNLEQLAEKPRRTIRSASAMDDRTAQMSGQYSSVDADGRPLGPGTLQYAQDPHAGRGPKGGTYIGLTEISKYNSAGPAKKVLGGTMSLSTRAAATKGLRVMSTEGVIAPASGPLKMGAGVDLGTYDPKDEVQGHRLRQHNTQLPPNRAALSKQWVNSTAMAYI